MASRENTTRLLRELRAYAEVTNRRPRPGAADSLWLPSRPPVVQAYLPRRKLFVKIEEAESSARPVRIQVR